MKISLPLLHSWTLFVNLNSHHNSIYHSLYSRSQSTSVTTGTGLTNISALIKEGLKDTSSIETPKFTTEEQYLVCSILCTAEYCLDTSQQVGFYQDLPICKRNIYQTVQRRFMKNKQCHVQVCDVSLWKPYHNWSCKWRFHGTNQPEIMLQAGGGQGDIKRDNLLMKSGQVKL